MSAISTIRARLEKLEATVVGVPIPTEAAFWAHWKGFDELSKSVYIACAENRMWELEADPQAKKYFENGVFNNLSEDKYFKELRGYLISAGLAKVGKSILEIAAELEAKKHGL